VPTDYKQAAVEQWTADPCGVQTDLEEGTRTYFEQQLAGRRDYAPWLDEVLDYTGTRGLDVLDVGSGQGMDVARYALAGARVTGIDLTPRHVELARSHLAALGVAATIVQGDAEAMPFPDASFDRVSSNGVLHHTPDMPAALREIHRVLRPGGEARVIVYNRNSFHYWLTQVLFRGLASGELLRERSMAGVLSTGVERSTIGARPLVRVYSPREVEALLRGAGFVGVSTRVRHFQPTDTPFTAVLHRLGWKPSAATRDRLGRAGGWYVIGRGRRER
jgi:SAM-dependent methyltransferase